MGVRVRASTLLAAAACVLTPATAQAFSISHFRVNATNSTLTYRLTTCGVPGYRVTFQALLEKDSGNGPTYTRTWRQIQRHNCSEWELETEDIWTGGLWDTQMTVFAHGQTHRTRVTVFDNGEEE
jgi:hypothetical protein